MAMLAEQRQLRDAGDAMAFAAQHDLLEPIQNAVKWVSELITPYEDVTLKLETDPDTGDQSIAIDLATTLSVKEVVERKRRFYDRWLESVTPDAALKIRLIVSIVGAP